MSKKGIPKYIVFPEQRLSAELEKTQFVQRLLDYTSYVDPPFGSPQAFATYERRALAKERACMFDCSLHSTNNPTLVPSVLRALSERRKFLKSFSLEHTIDLNRSGEAVKNITVYVIAPDYLVERATNFVAAELEVTGHENPHLLEDTHILSSFRGQNGHANIGGWLEVDNGFMCFKSWHMFNAFCNIFGIVNPEADPRRNGNGTEFCACGREIPLRGNGRGNSKKKPDFTPT